MEVEEGKKWSKISLLNVQVESTEDNLNYTFFMASSSLGLLLSPVILEMVIGLRYFFSCSSFTR